MSNSNPPTTKLKLISQGAEAKIFQNKNEIIKTRTPKTYRHPTLDQTLRTRRSKSEAKILARCAEAKINVPKIIHTQKFDLTIEHLPGERLSQTLSRKPLKEQISIIKKLATQIKKLHQANIIHADLTTSNTIPLNNKVYLIDFGLS